MVKRCVSVYLVFGTNAPWYTWLGFALSLVGMYGMFKKCGIPKWRAFVPHFNWFELGRCADLESDGRMIFGCRMVVGLLGVGLSLVTGTRTPLWYILLFLMVGIQYCTIVYHARVGVGLCEIFGRRKRWVVLWALIPELAALLWGWLPAFTPKWTVAELETEAANFFSGANVDALDQGLTVNLESRSVRKLGSKKYLLRDVHMYIKPGSMVLLLGGSGAGKTTLLNAINGYEPADAKVMLNGGDMYKQYKKMQYEVGFVPQQDLMRGSDTVINTLLDAAALRLPTSLSGEESRKRVDEVMDIFGLKQVETSLVSKLSGGQRKRLSIAMEFVSNPALFILDEPDSGLDGVMARKLMQQLRDIADTGKIVIVITHTPDRVIDLFDDVIVLAKDSKRTGRLAFYGSIDDAREFFGKDSMEKIVLSINGTDEGGEGRADEFILKYAEVQHV